MNYARIYKSIVARAKDRRVDGYTESHHVIPRCMGGTDSEDNLVELTPEEHYLCHQLLAKMYPDNIKLAYACALLSGGTIRMNRRLFGWLRTRISENWKGDKNPQRTNPRAGERHHFYGKKRPDFITEEGRASLRKRMIESNPNKGVEPWNVPSQNDGSRSIWKSADEIYILWKENGEPSYCRLYGLFHGTKFKHGMGMGVGPFMSVHKKFKSGWIPTEDEQWKKFKEE